MRQSGCEYASLEQLTYHSIGLRGIADHYWGDGVLTGDGFKAHAAQSLLKLSFHLVQVCE